MNISSLYSQVYKFTKKKRELKNKLVCMLTLMSHSEFLILLVKIKRGWSVGKMPVDIFRRRNMK